VKDESRTGRKSGEPEGGVTLTKTGEVSFDGGVSGSGDDGGEKTRIN